MAAITIETSASETERFSSAGNCKSRRLDWVQSPFSEAAAS